MPSRRALATVLPLEPLVSVAEYPVGLDPAGAAAAVAIHRAAVVALLETVELVVAAVRGRGRAGLVGAVLRCGRSRQEIVLAVVRVVGGVERRGAARHVEPADHGVAEGEAVGLAERRTGVGVRDGPGRTGIVAPRDAIGGAAQRRVPAAL